MLGRISASRALLAEVRAYLHAALGVEARIHLWAGARKLPYYLQDAFELHELQFRDKQILLASARKDRIPAPGALRTQLD